ncbi:endonuclease [Oceanobacillus alkalisoli]|uniref:endonuclease n=1 Tax=Oceanobacillus alkalisoli TaxID=2925113 RepID=UPI001F11C0D2|nr:endonuclease [Oceanobacillus alkalisoli]MCF3942819.1 endonuclease [Oceanobacillus alkalisoli]
MKRNAYALWMLLLTLVVSITVLPLPFQAETMDDPAPVIQPENPNGKKVLFDNTHAQTAGQADWVIDGAFSDFAEGIAANGYLVEEFRKNGPLAVEDLEDYDVFVIPEANIPFKKEEQDAMITYVENGGSIFFISDHYNADRNKNRWDSSEVMNGYRRGAHNDPTKGMSEEEKNAEAMQGVESSDWLSDHFGIRFRYNAPGTVVADQVVDPSETFGITEGVKEVTMHAGSTMAITDPEIAKGILFLPDGLDESDKWGPAVDEGIYHGGGVEEGPYAAISKLSEGKAAFIGDSSPVEDATPKYRNEETGAKKTTYDGFTDADNGELLLNMIDWLAEDESYESFAEAGIPLDERSPLLDKEIPENSTEPQAEPWSKPLESYDWFDPSTFAPGSFGSSVDPVKEPEMSLDFASVLPNNEIFTIEVVAEGLDPGQTVTGYNLGIYLEGGQQVAKVQNLDGSWPANYGYSEHFSLTANEEGIARHTLNVQLNENVDGNANVRLRQGSTNVITNPAVIGEAEEDNEETVTRSIQEARNLADGKSVAVEGVITTEPGLFGGQGFYVQDETAGIYVFQHNEAFRPGDKVKLEGVVSTHQGLKQISDLELIEVIGESELPEFVAVDKIDDANQGERVTLQGEIENIVSYWNAFEFDVRNGENLTRVRVDDRTNISYETFVSNYEEGEKVSVSGIASIFQDTYQLLVVDEDHIQKTAGAGSAPIIHPISDFTTFDITGSYQIPVDVYDEDGDLAEVIIEMEDNTMEDEISIEPLDYTPGNYEITVIARDEAGHVTEEVFPVEAILSLAELEKLVELGEDQGYLDEKMEKRLLKKALDVQTAKNEQARNGKWNALVNQIEAQSGKKIVRGYMDYWERPVEMR